MGTSGDPPGYGIQGTMALKRVLEMLGLAARAGDVVTGTESVRREVREGKIRLVILAADASPAQQRKLVPLLEARGVPYHVRFSQVELGTAVGRNPISAVGLGSPSFARRAGELLAAVPRRRGGGPRGLSQQE